MCFSEFVRKEEEKKISEEKRKLCFLDMEELL